MRSFEFVNEAISLTSHYEPLRKVVVDSVFAALDKIKPEQFREYRDAVNRDGRLHILGKEVKGFLEHYLKNILSKNLQNYIRQIAARDWLLGAVRVKFLKIEFSGYARDLDLIVNVEQITKLAEIVTDFLENRTLYGDYSENTLFSDFFRAMNEVIKTKDYDLDDLVSSKSENMLSTIIHELTHVVQHSRQRQKGRAGLEYRSYLDPRRQMFPDNSKFDDPVYRRMYKASPQEMAAFAHEKVLQLMRPVLKDPEYYNINNPDYSEKDKQDIINQLNRTLKYIPKLASQLFPDPSTPLEQKIYQRYVKLMYQEAQRFIDNLWAGVPTG